MVYRFAAGWVYGRRLVPKIPVVGEGCLEVL